MFGVYENGKPCSIAGFPHMHKSWNQHLFKTKEEAINHLNSWLGIYGPVPDGYDGEPMEINDAVFTVESLEINP